LSDEVQKKTKPDRPCRFVNPILRRSGLWRFHSPKEEKKHRGNGELVKRGQKRPRTPNANQYLLQKTKTDYVTPAKAGVQYEKAGFPLEFTPHCDAGRE